jgi:hypothetical protein
MIGYCCREMYERIERVDIVVCSHRRTDNHAALSTNYHMADVDFTPPPTTGHTLLDKSGVGAGKGTRDQTALDTMRTTQRGVSFGPVVFPLG